MKTTGSKALCSLYLERPLIWPVRQFTTAISLKTDITVLHHHLTSGGTKGGMNRRALVVEFQISPRAIVKIVRTIKCEFLNSDQSPLSLLLLSRSSNSSK